MTRSVSTEATRRLATRIRRHVLQMTYRARASHVGASLSMADLLAVLYGGILRIDPSNLTSPNRDRFVLSKGHGCAGLYATLAEQGFFPVTRLAEFYRDGTSMAGHVTHTDVPGVEVSTGALGHGLPIACGMALAGRRDRRSYRVFALLSDGECDEGATWEAALLAAHHRLDALVAIVDYNKMQSLGTVSDVLGLEPLARKWDAFGWSVREIDGHDVAHIHRTLSAIPFAPDRPSCVIAHTVKGKGVSFMENQLLWHYRPPDATELARALDELDPDV